MKIIARIHNKFTSKFGIPRQSGLENLTESTIVFENGFKSPDAIRGLENYNYIWLLWLFSECEGESEALTVRPPRLGGNTRMGVFATRSPFRPNSIGLSCVKLKEISADGSLIVTGADLMNGTPIIDIKPYLPYVDAHPEASNGFALASKDEVLEVVIPDKIAKKIDAKTLEEIRAILSMDPRPQYIEDSDRVFGAEYGGFNIKFRVNGKVLTVIDAQAAGQT